MNRIAKGMGTHDRRLTGKLVPMGSSANQTKIGHPDEFDFVYELTIKALLNGKGKLKSLSCSTNYNNVLLEMKHGAVSELVYNKTNDGEHNDVLDKGKGDLLFRRTLFTVLSGLKLPPGWQHGGFSRPSFSGLRTTRMSYVLQFDFLDESGEILKLSVDFVPMIIVSALKCDTRIFEEGHSLNIFLKEKTKQTHVWYSIFRVEWGHTFEAHYGKAEEEFLKKYSVTSTPKKLMRICKALRIYSQMRSPKYPNKSDVKKVLNFKTLGIHYGHFKSINQGLVEIKTNSTDRCSADYVSYDYLGETVGDYYLVTSYMIKYIVMAIMSQDKALGRDWTDDDLPGLVMTVYMAINNLHLEERNQRRFETVIEETASVETFQKNTAKRCSDVTFNQPGFSRPSSSNSLSSVNWSIGIAIKSRVASIFELFRHVCEEKITAELVFYNVPDPDSMKQKLLKKSYYKDLFQEIEEENNKRRDAGTDTHIDIQTDTHIDIQTDTHIDTQEGSSFFSCCCFSCCQ